MGKEGKRTQKGGARMLLRPTLLLLLAEGASHGYEMYDQLADFGFDPDCLDSSIVYRDLRDMESSGLITSTWDQNSKGPARRVYNIQAAGTLALGEWILRLENQQNRIDHIKQRYQSLH
jgi:PadR family transcriptional regulator PadR